MKKAISVLSLLVAIGSFSSCTKYYNCTCTSTTADTITNDQTSSTSVYKLREKSKKLADSKCQQNAYSYSQGRMKYATECTLEEIKDK